MADKNVFISYGQYYIILFSYIKHTFNAKKIDNIKGNSELFLPVQGKWVCIIVIN